MIDLLVVNHNTQGLLIRFLNSLAVDAQPHVYNLYVTDSGSTDGSADWVEHHAKKEYEITSAWVTGNVGYAAACNYMASQSSNEIIGMLNADVWMTTADVAAIQSIFDSDPSISILGPKQRDEEGRITHAGILGTNTHPEMRGWRQPDSRDLMYRDQMDCVSVAGSAYFIRRSTWDELMDCPIYKDYVVNQLGHPAVPGAFLPTFHYYEETTCSYHARAHGHRVVYDGRVSIGHTWHASAEKGSMSPYMSASRELFRGFCVKHGIDCD